MSLKDRVTKVDNKYHSDVFRRNLEDHLSIFRKNTTVLTVPSATGLKYKNNFLGLLTHLNVSSNYRYSTQRINDIIDPKACGVISVVYMPKYSDIDNLLSTLLLAERDLF